MLRLPEPGTFEALVSTVAVPTAGLWRLSKRPASEPCWARGAQSRFDDPAGVSDGQDSRLSGGEDAFLH